MKADSMIATVLFAIVAHSSASLLRAPHANSSVPALAAPKVAGEIMHFAEKQFMEVKLGPFDSASEACEYCYGSFTKTGDPPAGPVAPHCVCMSYPDGAGHTMFCATPPSAAKFVAEKKGCRCNKKDMESMGATTCDPI